MSKFESFVRSSKEKGGEILRKGALVAGIGIGALTGELQAQDQVSENQKNREYSHPDQPIEREYDLSASNYIGADIRARQENPNSLLSYNIDEVKKALEKARGRLSMENLDHIQPLISAYEEYLTNPNLDTKSVGDVYFEQENFIQNNKDFENYDAKIELLSEHISSPEYLEKLMTEYNVDREAAKEHQLKRLRNLEMGGYYLADEKAYYERNGNNFSVILPKNSEKHDFVAEHELLGHKLVDGNNFSRKANRLIGKSGQQINWDESEFKDFLKNTSAKDLEETKRILGNYMNISERYARKQVLEIEMESLGIKKYGEKFTDGHYEQLMELYNKGELSKDSRQFINTTKPEFFKLIFNEIAEDNSDTYFHDKWNYNLNNQQSTSA